MERNPLVDPAPGDVVVYRNCGTEYSLTVTEVGGTMVSFLLSDGCEDTERVPLDQWRDWSDFVVLEVSRGS